MRLWFGLFWRLGGWGALLLGLICLGVTWFSVHDYQLAARFDREAVLVPVTIERVWETQTHTSKGTKTYYHAQLDYAVGGQHLNREEPIDYDEYQRFASASLVQMRVLPDDPTQVETTKGETLGTARFAQVTALIFGLLALGLGWYFGRDAAQMALARRLGRAQQMTVIDVRSIGRKRGPPVKGQLVWIGPTGDEALSLPHPLTELTRWPKGSKIEVFIYKNRSFWAEDLGGRAGLTHDIPDVPHRG